MPGLPICLLVVVRGVLVLSLELVVEMLVLALAFSAVVMTFWHCCRRRAIPMMFVPVDSSCLSPVLICEWSGFLFTFHCLLLATLTTWPEKCLVCVPLSILSARFLFTCFWFWRTLVSGRVFMQEVTNHFAARTTHLDRDFILHRNRMHTFPPAIPVCCHLYELVSRKL